MLAPVFSSLALASPPSIDISITPWLSSWEQKSTAADRFGTDAIVVNYEIEDTIAYDFALGIRYGGLVASLQSIQQSDSVAGRDNDVSYTKIGLLAADAIADIDIDFQHTSGSFKGFIDGAANNGNTGTGTFESDLTLQDLSVLFFNGLGVGIRSVDYELPQDLYLVNKTAPNTAITAGFQEVSYSGTFIQLVAMSKDRYQPDSAGHAGFSYAARYGIGKIDPGGQFLNDTETLLRNNATIAAGDNIMDEGDSTFFEVDVSYYRQYSWMGGNIKTHLGYRHTQWEAEFGSNSTYQLVTDFETVFSGPYVTFTGKF